jgi:hypothetical protein
MFTWWGLEKTYIGLYFSYQLWLIKTESLRWSTLKSNYYQILIDFELNFFFHMVQYIVYYNFHVYKFGFYSHKNMLWLFEWKQSPRVLGFVCHYTMFTSVIFIDTQNSSYGACCCQEWWSHGFGRVVDNTNNVRIPSPEVVRLWTLSN